ncbi:hypothetical protein BPORC_1771 [Bifidobacterium porcinum]|nr:hypothetical protein BPORC_1771 [Bifidobacterium porcinum]
MFRACARRYDSTCGGRHLSKVTPATACGCRGIRRIRAICGRCGIRRDLWNSLDSLGLSNRHPRLNGCSRRLPAKRLS